MVLCDRLDKSKGLDKLFEDEVDIVYYDDIFDCVEKMNYYRENDEERERIAANGYSKVIENHTQKQRVDFVIQKFEEWKNSQ